jgi:4-amino-4-deoxy-L-arabinose transferase-like glycosyltransferase
MALRLGSFISVVWVAFVILLHISTRDMRLHADEAFYMTFARNAAINGDFWLSGSLDKPPLAIYTQMFALMLYGTDTLPDSVLTLDARKGEFVARITGAFWGMIALGFTYRLAWRWTTSYSIAGMAIVILVLSPHWMVYSASAFLDIPMIALQLVALVYVLERRWSWAGIAFGLAFITKPQAIFFLPLIGFIALQAPPSYRDAIKAILVSLAIVAIVFVWDALRPETSIFTLGAVNNALNDTSLALRTRLNTWLYQLSIGFGVLSWSVLALALLRRTWVNWQALSLLWVISFVGVQVIAVPNVYERYILPTLPILAILSAHTFVHLWQFLRKVLVVSLSALLVVNSLTPQGIARVLEPFGGVFYYQENPYFVQDSAPNVLALADYLNAKPIATVIYDHWLGWQMGYYMGQWTNKRRVYYPEPAPLVVDALLLDEIGTRYLIVPPNVDVSAWLQALESANFTVTLDPQAPAPYQVYAITPP